MSELFATMKSLFVINANTTLEEISNINNEYVPLIYGDADPSIVNALPDYIQEIMLGSKCWHEVPAAHIAAAIPRSVHTVIVNAKSDPELLLAVPDSVKLIVLAGRVGPAIFAAIPQHIIAVDIQQQENIYTVSNIPPRIRTVIISQPIPAEVAAAIPVHVHTVGIGEQATIQAIMALQANITAVGIWFDASPRVVAAIPKTINTAQIWTSASSAGVAALPEHIKVVELLVHSPSEAVREIPNHVEIVYLCGNVNPAAVQAIPKHIYKLGLRDVSPATIQAIPAHIYEVEIWSDLTEENILLLPRNIIKISVLDDLPQKKLASIPKHIAIVKYNAAANSPVSDGAFSPTVMSESGHSPAARSYDRQRAAADHHLLRSPRAGVAAGSNVASAAAGAEAGEILNLRKARQKQYLLSTATDIRQGEASPLSNDFAAAADTNAAAASAAVDQSITEPRNLAGAAADQAKQIEGRADQRKRCTVT